MLSGCLTSKYYKECEPLSWQGESSFSSDIELPGGHPYLSVGIRPSIENIPGLMKLADFDVKFTVINKGINILKISWMADREEEKKAGNVAVVFENAEEKRTILLKPGEELLWYVGKMKDLVNNEFISLQDYVDYTKKWRISLRLDFDSSARLKDIVNISKLKIPISAYCSDNI